MMHRIRWTNKEQRIKIFIFYTIFLNPSVWYIDTMNGMQIMSLTKIILFSFYLWKNFKQFPMKWYWKAKHTQNSHKHFHKTPPPTSLSHLNSWQRCMWTRAYNSIKFNPSATLFLWTIQKICAICCWAIHIQEVNVWNPPITISRCNLQIMENNCMSVRAEVIDWTP